MLQQFSFKTILLTLALAPWFGFLPAAQVEAQQTRTQQQRTDQSGKQQASKLTASQAAARAKDQYGGKVLKVTPSGNGYRVKILTETGLVRTVMIQG